LYHIEERSNLFTHFIPWAYRAGRKAPFLMNVMYENEYETPLEDLRKRLSIETAPKLGF